VKKNKIVEIRESFVDIFDAPGVQGPPRDLDDLFLDDFLGQE
jgi:hypothetical protein